MIAKLTQKEEITATVGKTYTDGINAANLKKATDNVEAGHMRGKVVVSGPFNGNVRSEKS